MTSQNEFKEYVIDLLAPLGEIRCRAMFGGFGIYCDGFFVAIIAYDTLFFKTNTETRPTFIKEGCKPFEYESKGRRVSLSYFDVPASAIDSTPSIAPWLTLAKAAAKATYRAKSSKVRKSS